MIEKSVEHKRLDLILMDYKQHLILYTKLIDSKPCRLWNRFLIYKYIYEQARACVRLYENTNEFTVKCGVSQGDTISPKVIYEPALVQV